MGLTIRKLLRLFDVNADGIADGETLVWDAAAGEFVPGAGGGGGAPTDATYLVTTAHADLSAEVAVGATPGGELGGTWASPTVDASHSGSTHAAVQAAAEATAAAALAAHLADGSDAHDASAISILDTAADFTATDVEGALAELQADAEADATALSDHIGDTSAAHAGTAISNTPAGAIAATTVQAAINELDSEKAAVSHAHAGEDITSGTVADARIAATIARDSEVTAAVSASEAGQVRDGDAAGGVLAGTYPSPSFAADMATQAELDAHVSDATAAHAASAVSADSTTLVGTGTDVQAVLEELDNGIADHLADTSAAHAASAISADSATLVGTGTDVQAVFEELDNAIVAAEGATAAHLADTSAAHAASAVSADSTTLVGTGTDVQAVLEELDNAVVATETVANAAVPKALYDANTVLAADSDNTPAALAMGASTILARLAAGNIKAATPAELRTLLALVVGTNVQAWDADLDVIAALADPNADRLLFWDDSAGAYAYLTAGTGLTITGTTIDAAGGGGYTLIEEKVAGAGGVASFDFTSISDSYRHLRIIGHIQSESATTVDFALRFNNDSGTSYYSQRLLVSNTTVAGSSTTAVAQGRIGVASHTTEAQPAVITIDIPDYSVVIKKMALAEFGGYWDSSTRRGDSMVLWTSTAAITQVTLLCEGGSDIKEASRLSLYGIT